MESREGDFKRPSRILAANNFPFHFPAVPGDEEPAKSSEPVIHPEVLMAVDGAYTDQARKKRLGGSVTLKLMVGADGRVHDAGVFQGVGGGLDENALKAIQMWRFQTATARWPPGGKIRNDFHDVQDFLVLHAYT